MIVNYAVLPRLTIIPSTLWTSKVCHGLPRGARTYINQAASKTGMRRTRILPRPTNPHAETSAVASATLALSARLLPRDAAIAAGFPLFADFAARTLGKSSGT
jgi:hypothetical protein